MNNVGFNPDMLSDLIIKAIGRRTHKAFAEEIEISATHLSRIIRKYFDYPPRKKTLEKIALHSESRVSLEDLLYACGFSKEPEDAGTYLSSDFQQAFHFFEATLLAALKKMNIPWTLEPSETPGYDLVVSFKKPYDCVWKFKYIVPELLRNKNDSYLEMLKLLLTDTAAAGNLISIVTNNEFIYASCTSIDPVNLDLDLSIVLIDQKKLLITKEKTVATSDHLNTYAKKLTLLKEKGC